MSMLSRIQRGQALQPPRIVIYGTEGIGKSTFGAQTPKPIFIPTEDGLGCIDCDHFPLVKTLEDVEHALRDLRAEANDYQTVVIDSADWLERIVWDAVCDQYGVQSIEKVDGGYGRGYMHALVHWRRIIAALDPLRTERGMVVLLIAHSKIERFEDPESTAYDRFVPRLHKHAAALICEWCDAVLFATRKIRTAPRTPASIASAPSPCHRQGRRRSHPALRRRPVVRRQESLRNYRGTAAPLGAFMPAISHCQTPKEE